MRNPVNRNRLQDRNRSIGPLTDGWEQLRSSRDGTRCVSSLAQRSAPIQGGLATACAILFANPSRSSSESYFVLGQKKPRRPSPFLRGTTCTCRCGTLCEILLFTATKLPSASRAV